MRRVASVGWLLLVGCNRIFGIAETQPLDANPDMPHVVLTWQLATTSPSGAPSASLEYPPFAPADAPQIRIATLDGPFAPASYSSDPATPGWILVPDTYFRKPDGGPAVVPWRLEYTLAVSGVPGAGVPHEVQWAPDDKIAHLVVPMVGRLDRSRVPSGGGYKVTLSNFTFQGMPTTSVLTTGLWTTGLTATPSGMVIDYDFSNATSLSGPRGSPDAAQGDRGFLIDHEVISDSNGIRCTIAVGSTTLTQLALTGTHTEQTVDWDTLRQPVTSELPGSADFARLGAGLGALHTMINSAESKFVFGSVPSTSFPGLIGSAPSLRLPAPVMQTLLQCPQGPMAPGPVNPGQIPRTAQPPLLRDFPTAVHVQLVEARDVQTPRINNLFSGIETVIAASAGGGGFRMSFPAAIPTQITLTTPAAGRIDLVNNTDQIAIGAPTGAFTLAFVPETGLRADYYDVYLHRITGGLLTTERIYTVTVPEVRIDGSVLASGADYVFEIRSYAGHVAAPRGDFAPVDYPYGSAVVFTRTFKTS